MMSREFVAETTSQPRPRRATVPGLKFSTNTSAVAIRSFITESPRGSLISIHKDLLPRFTEMK